MLQRDSLWVGFLAALIFPAAAWFGLNYMSDTMVGKTILGIDFSGFSESFIVTMAVCANFFPFFVYMHTRKDDAMRGVGLITMVLAVLVAVLYFL
ncbi:MAG: hypothetical protein GC205_04160 [Bacteroidetes bacterium]|nr:hypothetical protein [Bacteroidota bacterium]